LAGTEFLLCHCICVCTCLKLTKGVQLQVTFWREEINFRSCRSREPMVL
jgi:hypothetical protein